MQEEAIYIVAGDEMQKLFSEKFPAVRTIPFCEDFSKGSYKGFSFDDALIFERASFWGVSEEEYRKKMAPIMDLDFSKPYLLTFGEDECCLANRRFLIGYLKSKGYSKPIKVRVVNEYDLTLLQEFVAE